ncbi:glutathione S-transferase family protein [archaeon]|nr:MAG: glutathione S-transferase family protein [archaeon]
MRRTVSVLSSTKGALTIYGFPLSQPTRSVLMLCRENNIAHTLVNVDALKGDTKMPEFRQKNPMGMVPYLDDDGFGLAESAAILQYISEKHQLHQWYPADLQACARVNQWLHWHHSNTRNSTTKLLLASFWSSKDPKAQEEKLARGRKLVAKSLATLEHTFSTNPSMRFLANTQSPSIADLLVIPELDQQSERAFNLVDFNPYPHVMRYMRDVSEAVKSYEEIFQPVMDTAAKRGHK